MKILVYGSTGHMGAILKETIAKNGRDTVAACVSCDEDPSKPHTYQSLDKVTEKADVLIDFSNHVCTDEILSYVLKSKVPAVICTTGQTQEELYKIGQASKTVPIFRSGNMSLGIAVLTDLVKKAVIMFPEADVEIVEMHHNRKLDVPSGTVLMLADAVKSQRPDAVYNIGRPEGGKRDPKEIGIHSLRMGNEVGTHTVYINTGNEVLTLTHQAESRAVFADGALKAAEFLIRQQPGLYGMKEMLQ